MGESICVNLSAPAFSLLLYENTRNEYDQEGFLLGEIISNEKRTITDNDQEVISIEHIIKINSVIPSPKMAYFYDNSGRINEAKLRSFLGIQYKNVVSWYKFKHTSSFKLTLREKLIIKQLTGLFSPITPEHFLCCLLTTQVGSDSGATHLFSQTFIRYIYSNFQTLPMHITNLKDSHDIYKNAEDCTETFKNIIKGIKLDTKKTQGYTIVNKIEKALDCHISKVVQELSESEKKMYDLEQEVKRLREKLNYMHNFDDLEDQFGLLENGSVENEAVSDVTPNNTDSPRVTRSTGKKATKETVNHSPTRTAKKKLHTIEK